MFEEVSSINHEWRNSSTSKPSKLVTVTGCRESMGKWHHDMPQHSAILRSPSHTPGLGALVANVVFSQIDVRDGRVCLQRLGQGLETETDQGWRLHPGLYRSKSWSLKSGEHMTFNSDMWISLIQNLANNAGKRQLLTASTYLTTLLAMKNEWWNYRTSKPSKPVTVTGCRESMESDIMTCRSIQRSPSHTPGLGTLSANLVFSQIDVRDGRVCLQRLGQGLETETEQGWRLNPGLYRSNGDHWNPENTWHLTLTCESLWYRT